MTALGLQLQSAQAGSQLKDAYTHSAPISPSAASSISDSVFSQGDARSSQSSAPSSVKASPLQYESFDNDASDASSSGDAVNDQLGRHFSQTSLNADLTDGDAQAAAAVSQRRHPRRTAAKTGCATLQRESAKAVPSLVRQCNRKEQFVEALVDTATEMIEVIWPLSIVKCHLPQAGRNILDLRKFVQEVLRRSKTSHSTLQVALFYMMLLIPFVPKVEVPDLAHDAATLRALKCGRRMFLAALILASKYLQDRNYTMSAWAKISGLKKEEICFNELAFLKTVNFDLHVPEQKYKVWTELVFKCSVDDDCRMARATNEGRCEKWRAIIPHLTADLNVTGEFQPKSSETSPASTPSTTPAPGARWSVPASPFSAASECGDAPASAAAVPQPPPQFLEPKVTTSAEQVRFPRSPRLSKLETPCLPPINLDYSPAASRSQNSVKCPVLGQAMKQVQDLSGKRRCGDIRPCTLVPRIKSKLCSRRSGLSQCASSSGESEFSQDESSATPCARESYLRASPTVDRIDKVESDRAAARAAQSLLTLKNTNTVPAYPTPESMRSLSARSSFSSSPDDDDAGTPKAQDSAKRPVAKTAQKRARPVSKCETDVEAPALDPITMLFTPEAMAVDLPSFAVPQGMVKHRGALVDYGMGVDDVVRSRAGHMRSASGSRNGARKKPCSSLANCIRA